MAANKHIKPCFFSNVLRHAHMGQFCAFFAFFSFMLLLVAVVSGSSVMTTHRSHKPCDSASCYRNVKRPGAAGCVEEQQRCKYRCFGHGYSNMVVTNPSPQKQRKQSLSTSSRNNQVFFRYLLPYEALK